VRALQFDPVEPALGAVLGDERVASDDLVDLGEERHVGGVRMFGVVSGGEFFAMAPSDTLKDLI